jgi:non-heme chloroperoxidase
VQTAAEAYSTALEALTERQEKSVENGMPTVHVITLPAANHYLLLSNEAEMLKDIGEFSASLH